MIEYIQGELAQLTPTYAVIDVMGIGYGIEIALSTYTNLQGKSRCKLFIHEVIREDAHILYGFLAPIEREYFLLLTSVTGVGPNTARTILSSFSPNELEAAIAGENVAMLKSVKGIGEKTAQRVIVDLKGKIKPSGATLNINTPLNSMVQEEAIAALTMLGFAQAPSLKVVQKLLKESPSLKVEEVIKAALKMM